MNNPLASKSRYWVLLHNDEFNSMEYVVQTLLDSIPGLTEPQAVNAMMEAHHWGKGSIVLCDVARAKSYCEALCDRELNVTIELASNHKD